VFLTNALLDSLSYDFVVKYSISSGMCRYRLASVCRSYSLDRENWDCTVVVNSLFVPLALFSCMSKLRRIISYSMLGRHNKAASRTT
jgi:hypothetical protein